MAVQFKGVIFDMDGLLLDTERVCMNVFQQACQKQLLPFHEEIYLSIIGRNAASIGVILEQAYGDDLPRVHDEWRKGYNAIVMNEAIPLKQGAAELLSWLKQLKIPIAVATSTAKEVALRKLQLAGIRHYFETITTGCEVELGKPNPEIYLLAAERLGVEPELCVALEDSNNGVRAAVAANMITFQIPDLVQPSGEVIALGHAIVTSLHEVREQLQG